MSSSFRSPFNVDEVRFPRLHHCDPDQSPVQQPSSVTAMVNEASVWLRDGLELMEIRDR
jgi:hypothetical protein